MCTMIVEKANIDGSGKGTTGWFKLERANVSFDHPFHAPFEHALNIDFVNESQGPSAHVGEEDRRRRQHLDQAEAGGHLSSTNLMLRSV